MKFEIDDSKINDLQRASIHRMIARAKPAHFTNIYMRIGGKDETYEADWLKHLWVSVSRWDKLTGWLKTLICKIRHPDPGVSATHDPSIWKCKKCGALRPM